MDFNPSVTDHAPNSGAPAEPSGERPAPTPCPHCGADTTLGAQSCPSCHLALPGNTLALKHGGRRAPQHPDALVAIAAKRADLERHLGGDPSVIQSDLVTDYARIDTLIESVAANIERGGVFTPKGSARAATTMLLALVDRRWRLAQLLGIERRSKQVPSLTDFIARRGEGK